MLVCGIVGLPNVGKSTLFNALLRRQQAMVANYPFATIEPNVGIVPVPDSRLDALANVVAEDDGDPSSRGSSGLASAKGNLASLGSDNGRRPPIIPATVQFMDIAGLVKGAAEGAGLGNKFLSHIREVDLICEVVRAFPDSDIVREGSSEPKSDIEVINTELILADLQSLQKRKDSKEYKGDGEIGAIIDKFIATLDQGKLASGVELGDEEKEAAKQLQLLTAKKFIYVLNVNTATDWKRSADTLAMLLANGYKAIVIDAKLEADLSLLSPGEQEEYLESLGIKDSGVSALIREAYSTFGLISFLTAGVKEVRAWPIPKGMKAPQAAGTIHTDFEKGFIKAEVVDFDDFVKYNGWQKCREEGKVGFEGKEYEMKDGDVVEFKVNV